MRATITAVRNGCRTYLKPQTKTIIILQQQKLSLTNQLTHIFSGRKRATRERRQSWRMLRDSKASACNNTDTWHAHAASAGGAGVPQGSQEAPLQFSTSYEI